MMIILWSNVSRQSPKVEAFISQDIDDGFMRGLGHFNPLGLMRSLETLTLG